MVAARAAPPHARRVRTVSTWVLFVCLAGCGAAVSHAEPAVETNGTASLPARWRVALEGSSASVLLVEWVDADVAAQDSADSVLRARASCVSDALASLAAASEGRLAAETRVVSDDTGLALAREAGVVRRLRARTDEALAEIEEDDGGPYAGRLLGVSVARGAVWSSAGMLVDRIRDAELRIGRALSVALDAPLRIGVVAGSAVPPIARTVAHAQFEPIERLGAIERALAAVLVVAPDPRFTEAEGEWLASYAERGGVVIVLDRGVDVTLEAPLEATRPRANGLEPWLERLGVQIVPTLVGDAECGRAPFRSELGVLLVDFPPLVVPQVGPWIDGEGIVPVSITEASSTGAPEPWQVPTMFAFVSPLVVEPSVDATVVWQSSADAWRLGVAPIDLHVRSPREWLLDRVETATDVLGVAVPTAGRGLVVVVGTSSLYDDRCVLVDDERSLEPLLLLVETALGRDDPPSAFVACE